MGLENLVEDGFNDATGQGGSDGQNNATDGQHDKALDTGLDSG